MQSVKEFVTYLLLVRIKPDVQVRATRRARRERFREMGLALNCEAREFSLHTYIYIPA